MNPLQRFTDFVGNEVKYRTNEFNKAAQATRKKAEKGLKVRQEREASAGRALTNLAEQTVSSVKRAENNSKNVRAIRKAEFDGDTSKLTEEQKDLSRPIGSKSTLNGKPVKWSGQNYGWQSEGSYKKLEEKGEFRAGEIGYNRINSDIADGLFDLLGEANAIKLGETIQSVYDAYEEKTPGQLKDIISKGGDLFNQVNEEISKRTNVSPQITSELLIELGTAGAGKLVKKGGSAAIKATKNADLGSRVQELQRGLRGRNARPLNTGGSVGAAGAPNKAPNISDDIIDSDFGTPLTQQQRNQAILRDADPYSGPRLDDDAADGISRISPNTAPANTVNRQGQTRGAAVAQRAQAEAQQNGLNIRRAELEDQAYQRQAEVGVRNVREEELQAEGLENFSQLTREQQAQRNVVRRREDDPNQGVNALNRSRRRQQDFAAGREASRNGTVHQPMQYEYDTVINSDRVPVSSTSPSAQHLSDIEQGRIQAARTPNTIDGRRVVADSEARAIRGREAARTQAAIGRQQQGIEARNRLMGNPRRQGQALNRGRELGNDGLAIANTQRRIEATDQLGRRAEAQAAAGQDYAFPIRRDRRVRGSAEAQFPEDFERTQMQARRPANTMPRGRELVNDTTNQAIRSGQVRKANRLRAEAERQKRLAASRQKRYASGRAARQAQGVADATAAFQNGPQPVKGGEEGSRLFTPRNRAEANKRAGNKLNPQHSSKSRNTSVAGGKAAYANKHTTFHNGGNSVTHDVGFRSTNLRNGYARDAEKKLRGDQVSPKSRTKRKLESATIKNNLATIFSRVKEGDVVTASPIEGIKGRNGRAKLYDRMSKGALKADEADNIESVRLSQNKWQRDHDGAIKDWNPEDLRKDLDALTQATPEQLRGRAIGGSSQLRIKGKNISGTKTLNINKQSRPNANTRNNKKRQQQALNRISKFAEKNGMSAEEAVQYLQSNL